MKQALIIATVFLASCYGKTNKPKPTSGKAIIPAVYQSKGTKKLDWVLRVNEDKVKTDSATGKKSIVTDTLYGIWDLIPVPDKYGKPIKTSNGKDSLSFGWMIIGRDSVNTHIENISIDSLLKK